MKQTLHFLPLIVLVFFFSGCQPDPSDDRNDEIDSYENAVWRQYNAQNTGDNTIPDGNVHSVYVDRDQNIWVGTYDQGIVMFDGETWHDFSFNDQLENSSYSLIHSIYQDSQSNIWFSCFDLGLCLYADDNLVIFTTGAGELLNDASVIGELSDGRILVNATGTVLEYDGISWSIFDFNYLYNDNSLVSMLKTDSQTWYGTSNGGFYLLENEEVTHYDYGWSSSSATVDIKMDSSGKVWIAFSNFGLYSYSDGTWEHHYNGTPLTDVRIKNICIDNDDVIWVCTSHHGVFSYDGITFSQYNDFYEDQYQNVREIAVDDNDKVWVATENGVYTVHETIVEKIGPDGLGNNVIREIFADSRNRIWIKTASGLSMLDGSNWHNFDNYFRQFEGSYYQFGVYAAIIEDEDNNILVGSSSRLFIYDNNSNWSHIAEQNGFNLEEVDCLYEMNDGSIAVFTNNELLNWNGSAFQRIEHNLTLSASYTRNLICEFDNEIITHCDFKIRRLDGSIFPYEYGYQDTMYLPFWGNEEMISTDRALWTVNSSGISKYDKNDESRWINYVETGDTLIIMDGSYYEIRDSELSIERYKTVVEDIDGNIWVGGLHGLAREINCNWSMIENQFGTVNYSFTCSDMDGNGNLWFGTENEGIFVCKLD